MTDAVHDELPVACRGYVALFMTKSEPHWVSDLDRGVASLAGGLGRYHDPASRRSREVLSTCNHSRRVS